MPKKKGRRHGNSSAKKKDTSEEHRTPELIEAMRAVEQTADFDMEACARECSELQEKLTADYESIELNPSTPESRMADKVFDIAFDLKPDWLIKNTGSIESLKIYSKLPIDKNDPDFKDSKGQRLVDLTSTLHHFLICAHNTICYFKIPLWSQVGVDVHREKLSFQFLGRFCQVGYFCHHSHAASIFAKLQTHTTCACF